MTMIFPAVWEGFGGILWYFQETPGLLPGRFTIFNKWQTKLQVRNIPFSNRAFLAHMCPIYRKTAAGSCNGNQRWVEVMNHLRVSVGTSSPGKQICFSTICCSRDFHFKETSGVLFPIEFHVVTFVILKLLSCLYRERS